MNTLNFPTLPPEIWWLLIVMGFVGFCALVGMLEALMELIAEQDEDHFAGGNGPASLDPKDLAQRWERLFRESGNG